VRKSKQLL